MIIATSESFSLKEFTCPTWNLKTQIRKWNSGFKCGIIANVDTIYCLSLSLYHFLVVK